MKTLIFGTLFFLLSGCAVASLAGTAISTTVKIAEVPLKVAGSILKEDDDDEEKENQ